MLIGYVARNKIGDSYFILVISWSFGEVAPSYNIASKGNSDSRYEASFYELPPGT
jgi:hypothetical protein